TELGDVITGRAPGRRSGDDVTLYNSVGVGIQDVVAARLVVDAARRQGIGTEVHLS
ncbi:ornithine cyclodeaminase family protein, partial [Streptomyces sp. NPDC056159]